MSMDKGHNGRYVYTTIHRQFAVKPVLRAMEKGNCPRVQVNENIETIKDLYKAYTPNGFSALVELFER